MTEDWTRINSHAQYFMTLGVSEGSSVETAKAAHRELLMKWHPDRFPAGDPRREDAVEKIKEINLALSKVQEFHESGIAANIIEQRQHTKQAERDRKLSKIPTTITEVD